MIQKIILNSEEIEEEMPHKNVFRKVQIEYEIIKNESECVM